jgi:hypothetical protein
MCKLQCNTVTKRTVDIHNQPFEDYCASKVHKERQFHLTESVQYNSQSVNVQWGKQHGLF